MNREWMYTFSRSSLEYRVGVLSFIYIASGSMGDDGITVCPCSKCNNRVKHPLEQIEAHLYRNGFKAGYNVWIHHGEAEEGDCDGLMEEGAETNEVVEQEATNGVEEARDDVDEEREKRKRGHTRLVAIEKARKKIQNEKLPVMIDTLVRQAVGTYSEKFNNACGYVARNFLPLDVDDWRKIPDDEKQEVRRRLEENFEIDTNSKLVQDVIDFQMNKSWRQFKWRMHKHFKKIGGETDPLAAKSNKPVQISEQATWDKLCDMWGQETKKARCNKNAENRAKRPWESTTGSISTPNHHIRRGLSLQHPVGAIETFRTLHQNEDGWKTDATRIAYEAMTQIRQEHPYNSDNQNSMTDLDIMETVLGHRSGLTKRLSRKFSAKALALLHTPDTFRSHSNPEIEARLARVEEFVRKPQSHGQNSTPESAQQGHRDLIDQGRRLSRLEELFSQYQKAHPLQVEMDVQRDKISRLEEKFSQFLSKQQADVDAMVGRMTRLEEILTCFMERTMGSTTPRPPASAATSRPLASAATSSSYRRFRK